jgi:3-deoxy-D-manno-octulosonate 8-phosphate phosphatase (KDO 8-P phosphatase)
MYQVLAPVFDVNHTILERAAKIKLILFDVDGVLTDGRLFLGDDGQEYKAFNSKDGHGIKMLLESGVEAGIITGRTSKVVEHRVADLGIKHVYQGCLDKLPVYEALQKQLGLQSEQTAFMGDDIVDLPIMLRAGLSLTVQDAHYLVKQHAHWVTPSRGGGGAAREACEMIMYSNGTYTQTMRRYL